MIDHYVVKPKAKYCVFCGCVSVDVLVRKSDKLDTPVCRQCYNMAMAMSVNDGAYYQKVKRETSK